MPSPAERLRISDHQADPTRRPPARAGPEAGRSRRQLGFAAAAVLLAAADTYVVVAVLPAIMGGVGLGVDHLQQATPIISGFLLGYTVVLPLLGRLSDLVGRAPVFVACLTGFAIGSLLTATAHALGVLVAGRALQGLGGGGLVPVTLSLVAERWPPEDRGLPLGIVGAVQELGSVLGPLYGAAIVTVSTWRTIFWLNLPLAAVLGAGFVASRPRDGPHGGARRSSSRLRPGRPDIVGPAMLILGFAGFVLALAAPARLADDVTLGAIYNPVIGGSTWAQLTSPLALVAAGILVGGLAWEAMAPFHTRVIVPLRRVPSAVGGVDMIGAALLAGVLACIVILFSTEDPSRQVVASGAPLLVPLGVALLVAFAWQQRRSDRPLIPPRLLAARPAWGALVVNLALGAALMAALVDVPLFARATVDSGSQIDAALVLVRFLVAVPVGAVAGGLLCRRVRRGPWVAGAGMAAAALMFVAMATWSSTTLMAPMRFGGLSLGFGASDVELVLCGLGFGLAIAPVNAAILGAVPARAHGLATSLVVVARTVGMLAGLSALTAIGLHRFYQAQAKIGSPVVLCPSHPESCGPYLHATSAAVLTELHTIFIGAAVGAGTAAMLAAVVLRGSPTGRGTLGSVLVAATPPGGATADLGAGEISAVPGAAPAGPAVGTEHSGM
ncbi:MAG: MFS transporter [Actinomycetota bacterium]|nr:MFS transporter [Actinomycetota bacterium]